MAQQVVYRTREMQRLEAQYGRSMGDLLSEWYLDEGLTFDQIGERLGISKGAVSRWMDRFGIDARRSGPRREQVA